MPSWTTESVDLSEYTGREVLVRFQYATNLYEGRIGLALDDIEILELEEPTQGAESDQSLWIPEGFKRAPEQVAQPWVVGVIDSDGMTRLELTDGVGDISFDLGVDGMAVVELAATSPGTGAAASYRLTLEGDAELLSMPGPGDVETFDVPCSGWEIESTPTYALVQERGGLAIEARGLDSLTWSAHDGYHDAVTISTDLTFGSATDGAGGLMCRLSGAGFYEFNVSSDGFFLVGAFDGFDYTTLADWTESDSINLGEGANNHVVLECGDGYLTASVNGHELLTVDDDRLPPGQIALLSTSFTESSFEAFYDNVLVSSDPTAIAGIVSFDDFEKKSLQWAPYGDRGANTSFIDGEFTLAVEAADWSAEAYSTDDFENLTLSADFRIVSVAPDALVGVACHTDDQFDQYLFLLSLDGSYAVQGIIEGEFVEFVPWTPGSGLYIEPDTVNHLQITCADGRLVWHLNGWLLADLEVDSLQSGRAGLIAYTYEFGDLEIRFDNIRIIDTSAATP